MSNRVVLAPSPRISSVYQTQAIVSSGLLPIPPVQRHPNGRNPSEEMGSRQQLTALTEYIASPAYHNPASTTRTENNEETPSSA